MGVAADDAADAGGGVVVHVHKRYLHFGFAQGGRLLAAVAAGAGNLRIEPGLEIGRAHV